MSYEQAKIKKIREDIGRRENTEYLREEDAFLCKNGRKLVRIKDYDRVYDSVYKEFIKNYHCNECASCPLIKQCIKSRKETTVQPTCNSFKFSLGFEEFRQES